MRQFIKTSASEANKLPTGDTETLTNPKPKFIASLSKNWRSNRLRINIINDDT